MENLTSDDLTIEADTAAAEVALLRWTGRSAARRPGEVLLPYFAAVAGYARDNEARVEMQFAKLEYLNSSTLAAIIRGVRELAAQGTAVRLVYDGSVSWQAKSFGALRVLEADRLIEVQAQA